MTSPANRSHSDVIVGLLWHSVNSGNLGIGALAASQVAIIDKVASQTGNKVQYRVIGWRDPASPYLHRQDIEPVSLVGRDFITPTGLCAAVKGCDLVLDISAGDSFTDIYGARRFVFNALSKIAVIASRRPLILSPQTIGPFQRWWTRHIAGLLMRAARKVVTRDALSSEFLRTFGLGDKIVEATDVAFRLPYSPPPPHPELPIRVGVNISGLLFSGGYTRDNMFALAVDYPALARAIISHFAAQPDCEVHLIGHVNTTNQEVEDDFRVAKRLAMEFRNAIVAPRFESPSAAKSYIATMDFFCGSRMHACIAACSSGVPVFPIAYSRKFAGLFGTLGYQTLADCKTQNADEILAAVSEAFAQRNVLKSHAVAACKAAEEKLANYEAILHDALRELQCRSR